MARGPPEFPDLREAPVGFDLGPRNRSWDRSSPSIRESNPDGDSDPDSDTDPDGPDIHFFGSRPSFLILFPAALARFFTVFRMSSGSVVWLAPAQRSVFCSME